MDKKPSDEREERDWRVLFLGEELGVDSVSGMRNMRICGKMGCHYGRILKLSYARHPRVRCLAHFHQLHPCFRSRAR